VLKNRYDKDEAFQWRELGNGIDFIVATWFVLSRAPEVPFFAAAR
jgi:hypothetical protein